MSDNDDSAVTMIHTLVSGGEDGDQPSTSSVDPSQHAGLDRGTSLGRYIVLDRIGAGGMSAVYAAYDPELDRKVALKLLHAEGEGSSASSSTSASRTRLIREAQAMAKLSHPNVVRVFDVGTWEGEVFIAMEIIDGWNLKEWLRMEERSWQDVREIMVQAGRGLAAAHQAGLVHRDFKPENVLIGRETNRAYVVDFGLVHPDSRHHNDSEKSADPDNLPDGPVSDYSGHSLASEGDTLRTTELTQLGTIMGTPPYMAPEQHRGERTEPRTDQFCFCVTLFEALFGERPFKGSTLSELRSQVLSGTLNFPPYRKVPNWFQKIIKKGLSVEIVHRYPSMEELLTELARDPGATRRRVAGTAVSLVALLGAAVAYPELRGEQVIPCADVPQALDGVWDEPRRTGIMAKFAEIGTSFSSKSAETVTAKLDAYGKEWLAMAKESCEASEVRGEQSGELRRRREDCLDQKRSDMQALTNLFLQGQRDVLAAAPDAVHRLDLLDSCANTTALSAIQAKPEDRETLDDLAVLQVELSRLKALRLTRQYDGLATAARAAVEEAVDLEYPPTVADAHLELAREYERRGQTKLATNNFNEALWAAEASHYDRVAAVAALHLVGTKGATMPSGPAFEHLLAHADATVERHGSDLDLDRRQLSSKLDVAIERQRLYVADELAPRLRELFSNLDVAGDPSGVHTSLQLGDIALLDGEPERAKAFFQTSIDLAEYHLGIGHPKTAAALQRLGTLHLDAGESEIAIEQLQAALNLEERFGAPEGNAHRANAAFSLARAIWPLQTQRQRARELAQMAEAYFQRHPERHAQTLAQIDAWLLDHPAAA